MAWAQRSPRPKTEGHVAADTDGSTAIAESATARNGGHRSPAVVRLEHRAERQYRASTDPAVASAWAVVLRRLRGAP
jgi:hypothetical protein